MPDDLTLDDLSARTGEAAEELRRWQSLGLLSARGGEAFRPEDVERVKLIQLFVRRGIDLDAIVRAEEQQPFLERRIEMLFPRGVGPTYSLAEAAEMASIDLDVARRFFKAGNLFHDGVGLEQEDVMALRGVKQVLDAGYPEEARLQVIRVYADTMERAAEAGQRAFHFYVHERMRAAGMSPSEVREAVEAVSQHALALAEPTVLYFFRKARVRAQREDFVMHVAEEAGLAGLPDVPGQLSRAIMFVDLSSFTPLAEAMGDVKAAEVLDQFSLMVRDAAHRWEGQVIKQIGDAFMLVFPDARSAVACSLEIEARTAEAPQFPAARSGVHWGRVLYREGDYVGSNVNVAARVAAEAQRHQTLVTSSVWREAKGLPDVEFVRLGKRRLRGLAREVDLFEARPMAAASREKSVDPVCGMELGADEVAARLTLDGGERTFCSEDCLRQFVAAPERYPAKAAP